MFDLQIDKKKKKCHQWISCEKKQQHIHCIVKIFYMWMFCITLKGRNTKRFVQNWHSPSHLRQNGHDFYRTYNSFSLFAMQLDYYNIQSVWSKVETLTVYIDIK